MLYLRDMETEVRHVHAAKKLISLYSHMENLPFNPPMHRSTLEEKMLVVCSGDNFCGCVYLLHHQNTILAIYMSSENPNLIGRKREIIRELLSAQYPDKRVFLDVKYLSEQV